MSGGCGGARGGGKRCLPAGCDPRRGAESCAAGLPAAAAGSPSSRGRPEAGDGLGPPDAPLRSCDPPPELARCTAGGRLRGTGRVLQWNGRERGGVLPAGCQPGMASPFACTVRREGRRFNFLPYASASLAGRTGHPEPGPCKDGDITAAVKCQRMMLPTQYERVSARP